jgi:hypothetical protein
MTVLNFGMPLRSIWEQRKEGGRIHNGGHEVTGSIRNIT